MAPGKQYVKAISEENGGDMITEGQMRLVRWCFLASLVLFILSSIIQLLEHPAVAIHGGTEIRIYLSLYVLALLIYGWFALFRTHTGTTDERVALQQGTCWGLLCGTIWAIELLVGNFPLAPSGPFMLILYRGSSLLGFLLPVFPSLLTGWQTGRISPGIQAGLLCGMLGGLMIFLTWLLFSVPLFQVGLSDQQTITEFRHSGLPDIITYIAGDWLAALIGHLWIGLITGLLLGVLGGTIGKSARLSWRSSETQN
ncbi:hypothetical protein KDA_70500 [Dictyobacter alpinus]|uniref:Uncharacterized protein n=1 Tax=Dictyobacter alpinus TaxID=2014873 RepID=A0A402BJR4_9CHLR|nr:hypothetical protein [Dictyobacter alpinus]GCE31566.1 hypothetical protein KDA_70500 [Dictyobacter alpinus]